MSEEKINALLEGKGKIKKKSISDLAVNVTKSDQSKYKNSEQTDILNQFNHSSYKVTKPIYIDSDLHEVLMIIKNNSTYTMGEIGSSIIESFVKKNIDDIKNLNVVSNKYLND